MRTKRKVIDTLTAESKKEEIHHMKKMVSLTLALSLCAAMFAGCSSPSPSTSTPSETASDPGSAASSAASQEESSGAKEFENKELNIAIFEGGYGPEYWEEIVSQFETTYGVNVTMQISPTIGDIIRPQIVAGNVPDFISMNDNDTSGLISSLIRENALMDITDVFEGPGLEDTSPLKDQVLDGVLDTAKCSPYSDGKIYLAPFNASPLGLVYNKTLFKENNWELPETWDEFFELGDKAKEKGIALLTYAGQYPGYMESLLWPAIASAAGLETATDISSYVPGSFSSPEVMAVLENIQKISTGGYLMEGSVALNHTQSQTEMMMNKAVFIPNGNWMEGEMKDAPRAEGFEFGLTTAPSMKAGDARYVMTSVEQFSIPAAAKNPELAKEFLRFLYTEDSVKLFAEKAGGIYALKEATEWSKDYVSEGVYSMNEVYDVGNSMVFGFAALPEGCKVTPRDEVFQSIADLMNGAMTPEEWSQKVEASFTEVANTAG